MDKYERLETAKSVLTGLAAAALIIGGGYVMYEGGTLIYQAIQTALHTQENTDAMVDAGAVLFLGGTVTAGCGVYLATDI